MARVALHALTDGISGALGNLVFRQYGNKTVVSQKAAKPTTQTMLQKKNRMKFREATLYAKSAMLDPQKKAYYQQKAKKLNLPNAYTAAITEFMRNGIAKEEKKPVNFGSQQNKTIDLDRLVLVTRNKEGVILDLRCMMYEVRFEIIQEIQEIQDSRFIQNSRMVYEGRFVEFELINVIRILS